MTLSTHNGDGKESGADYIFGKIPKISVSSDGDEPPLSTQWEERFDVIKEEWKKHATMNTCSICDSPKGHTEMKDFIRQELTLARAEGRQEALKEAAEIARGIRKIYPAEVKVENIDLLSVIEEAGINIASAIKALDK